MYNYNPAIVWYGGGDINIVRGKQRTVDFNKPASDDGANKSRYVTFASGCAMMFKRDILEKAGGFDSRFFMYVEDLELCMRIKKMGYKIWYTASTQILHKVHASSDNSVKTLPALHPDNPKLPFYMYHMVKNMLLTMNGHLTKKQWLKFLATYMSIMSYKNMIFFLKGRFKANGQFFKAIADFNKEKKLANTTEGNRRKS